MINIKKIYQEIERRKEQAKEHYNEPYSIGRCDAFAEMLNFINSLEEKSEILKDFNEAAKEYANKEFPDEPAVGQWGTGDYEQPVDMEYPREIAEESFRAGAEWAVRQGVDFKIEERKWVHDAVDNIFPEDGDFMSEVDFRKILKDTARHFFNLGLNARKEEK